MKKIRYKDDELLDILIKEYKETGMVPLAKTRRGVSPSRYQKLFGSFKNALKLANIPIKKEPLREKVCKYKSCNNVFVPRKTTHKYCSLKCSNNSRRIHPSREVLPLKEFWENRRLEIFNKMMNSKFEDLSYSQMRQRCAIEQNDKCNKCELAEWLGEKIPLEYEHKDGDNSNNNRENVEMLCPNCHSLTSTWRGRNRKDKPTISDEDIIVALDNTRSIREALRTVGLAEGAGNYKRIYRIKAKMGV